MDFRITNAQRTDPVNTTQIRRLASHAARQLAIRTRGRIEITFLDARRIQALNKQFLRHDRSTDVLSFRYDVAPASSRNGPSVVGEIFIAPSEAKAYAKRHGLSYAQELSRYVVHGLLHWLGEEDRSPAQQQRMRHLEDGVLEQCGWRGAGAPTPARIRQSSLAERTAVGSRSDRTRNRNHQVNGHSHR